MGVESTLGATVPPAAAGRQGLAQSCGLNEGRGAEVVLDRVDGIKDVHRLPHSRAPTELANREQLG